MGNPPTHYARGDIQPWDFIRDQGLNYFLGNAVKYIVRAGFKDSKADDLKKAIHYLENELQHTLDEAELERSSNRISNVIRCDEWGDESPHANEFDR